MISTRSLIIFTLIVFPAFGRSSEAPPATHAQMVNLNFQIKSNNTTLKSDLTMPFYQTAEVEKVIDNKNIVIEINPRHGKSAEEVALEMKFYRAGGPRAFYKKDIVAKINQESMINVHGLRVFVKPVIN